MSLELTNFFFGMAAALFISILAWGNFIKKPREDLLNLEQKYIEYLGVKKKQILPLIRPYSTYTFTEQMNSILDLWSNKKVKGKDVELSKEIKNLHMMRKKLEFRYSFRYLGALLFTLISFTLGILSELLGAKSWTLMGTEIVIINSWLFISIFLLIVLTMLVNSLTIYIRENKFAKTLFEASDKTED